MLLDGACRPDVITALFGGNLTALMKKSGSIRPIAVDYTWRRIAAKCFNAFAISSLGDCFAPTQLGAGISGGCEAAVHAARRFIENMPSDYVVAKLDFSNVFNNLHRDVMLQSVFNKLPDIYKLCYLCYGQQTFLRYGSETILSQEGTQLGHPLEPLLFCLALHPLLLSQQSELIIGYIDDITYNGGPKSVVTRDVDFINKSGLNFDLLLNAFKCELITSAEPEQDCIFNSFAIAKPSEASLLGAPLFSGTILDDALKRRHGDFVRLSVNMRSIYAHDALLIMKFSLSTPKILHLLRCSPF